MQRTRDFPENGNFQKLEKIKSHNMTYTKQQKSELTREINAQKNMCLTCYVVMTWTRQEGLIFGIWAKLLQNINFVFSPTF